MFAWFKSFFKGNEDENTFHPKKRILYRYWNGKDYSLADPMVIYKKLLSHGNDILKNLQASFQDSDVNAHDNLLQEIRQVFKLQPAEEGGLTQLETLALCDHFMNFVANIMRSAPVPVKETPQENSPPANDEKQEEPKPLEPPA